MDKRLAQKVLRNCTRQLLALPTVRGIELHQENVASRSSCVIRVLTKDATDISSSVQTIVTAAAVKAGKLYANCNVTIHRNNLGRVRHQWVGYSAYKKGVL